MGKQLRTFADKFWSTRMMNALEVMNFELVVDREFQHHTLHIEIIQVGSLLGCNMLLIV